MKNLLAAKIMDYKPITSDMKYLFLLLQCNFNPQGHSDLRNLNDMQKKLDLALDDFNLSCKDGNLDDVTKAECIVSKKAMQIVFDCKKVIKFVDNLSHRYRVNYAEIQHNGFFKIHFIKPNNRQKTFGYVNTLVSISFRYGSNKIRFTDSKLNMQL